MSQLNKVDNCKAVHYDCGLFCRGSGNGHKMQFTVLTANDTWRMTIQSQYVRIMPFELVSSRIRTFILGSWKAWSFATAFDEKESRLEELALRVKEHPFLRQKNSGLIVFEMYFGYKFDHRKMKYIVYLNTQSFTYVPSLSNTFEKRIPSKFCTYLIFGNIV